MSDHRSKLRARLCSRLIAVVALLSACATNPATGKREFNLVSEAQEISMGQEGAKEVRESMGLLPDSNVQRYVRSLGLAIAQHSERPNLPWSYQVVDDPVVNAFELPGGPVFITRGILGYLNSEAELVSVIGHETGHVTARHSARQMSRAQLAQIGLVAGAVLSPRVAQFGDVLSQGLGLVFLKYGRDDETQADDLGFKYTVAQGYDAREMAAVFHTLDRVTGTAKEGRPPEWLSTHPDPGNRVAKTQERLAALHKDFTGTKVNRDVYLQAINGIVFGENPRQGYFSGAMFYHPDLKFQLEFPSGWKTQNQVQAVVGVSAQQDAMITLQFAGNASPQDAARTFLGQQGIQTVETSTRDINGLAAAAATFSAQTEQGQLAGIATFVSLDGTTYRVLGYTPSAKFRDYAAVFQRAAGSFRRLTDAAALSVQPARVRIQRVPRTMTLTDFNREFPSTIPIAQLAIINGVEQNGTLTAGSLAKQVVGGGR
jgi:predicted Zn-dependent protease